MGNPNPRTKASMEHRRKQVAEMYLQRLTQRQIGERLGVDHSTVSTDLRAIREEWKAERLSNMDEALSRELAELDEMEAQLARKWLETEEPIWINQRLKLKEQRAKLLGLNSPEKQQIQISDAPPVMFYLPDNGRALTG